MLKDELNKTIKSSMYLIVQDQTLVHAHYCSTEASLMGLSSEFAFGYEEQKLELNFLLKRSVFITGHNED